MSFLLVFGLFWAIISSVCAQTWTTCDPLNTTTCQPDPALGITASWNFSTNSLLDNTIWNITNGAIDYTDQAAQFTIHQRLDSPTVQSTFYIFFGTVETHVQAAPGQGVVSSVVLQSDDLDEIDWEWIGSQGTVQSNYYSKGNLTYGRAQFHQVAGANKGFHNYTTHWTPEKLEWWIDGALARTVAYADADNGSSYPQTPMTVRLGIWPGGDPSEPQGTREWAGGEINYSDAPFNMYVSQVRVHDFHTGKEYTYGDRSGTWQSINVVTGNSTVATHMNDKSQTIGEKWAALPQSAKAGVYVGAAGALGLLLVIMVFCCIKQRRDGRKEQSIHEAKLHQERTEMMHMQAEWRKRGYTQFDKE